VDEEGEWGGGGGVKQDGGIGVEVFLFGLCDSCLALALVSVYFVVLLGCFTAVMIDDG
jgi:hypothetical protein